MGTRTDSKILLCDRCEGYGTSQSEVLVDHHKGDYETQYTICFKCNGSGRVRQVIETTITTEPYENPKVAEIMFKKLKKTA